jgi:hypothetical protein
MEIMTVTTSFEDVVANRGEDLRFPISSSSGFSSPFAFFPDGYRRGPAYDAGFFFLPLMHPSILRWKMLH